MRDLLNHHTSRQSLLTGMCTWLPPFNILGGSAAFSAAVIDKRQFGGTSKPGTVLRTSGSFCTPLLNSGSRFSDGSSVEMSSGRQDVRDYVHGGFDGGIEHRATRGIPCGVCEERDEEEGGEAQGASDDTAMQGGLVNTGGEVLEKKKKKEKKKKHHDLQRRSQKGQDQANLLHDRCLQFEKNGHGITSMATSVTRLGMLYVL